MKNFKILFLFIVFHCVAYTQQKEDTLFLAKDKKRQQQVFVLPRSTEKDYDVVFPKLITEETEGEYVDNFHFVVQDTTIKMHSISRHGLVDMWVPLYIYNGEYYVTRPLPNKNLIGMLFTDTTLITQKIDGFGVEILLSSVKSKNSIDFVTLSTEKEINTISIFVIDKENEIAVWKRKTKDSVVYQLFVSASHADQFPLVIQQCDELFFQFDDMDYNKILEINNLK